MKIHGHPQVGVTDYPETFDAPVALGQVKWPTRSFQAHWVAPGLTPMAMAGLPGLCHTHIDVTFPEIAELSGPVVCKFAVKLFHTQGRFGGFYTSLIRDVVWDETGTAEVPVFLGDPMGLVVKTGHFTLDPAMATYYPNTKHGWAAANLTGGTAYDNGDVSQCDASLPFWSMLDPSVPILPIGNGGGPIVRTKIEVANTTIFAPNTTPINYGETLVETGFESEAPSAFMPLAPISAPYTLGVFSDGYGSADLPAAMFEVRLDLDIHNNIPGTVLLTSTDINAINRPILLDPQVLAASTPPAGLAPNVHKVAMIRRQTDGPEAVWALLVIDVEVAPNLPPPTQVTVPNVMGQSQATAVMTLQTAGLTPLLTSASDPMVPAGNVSQQVPMMGVTVNKGSAVTLTISTGPVVTPSQWVVVTPIIKKLTVPGGLDRFCLCVDGTTECVELVVKPDPGTV